MRMYKMMGLGLAILLSLSVTGCGVKQVAMSGEGESYAVVDATGQEVKIPGKPKRILGNSASIDTMLLGVVTADHLVGATEADRDPAISYIVEDTKDIPMTIPLSGLSMELVTQARPDLVVASTYTKGEELTMYRNLGIPVVVIDGPRSIQQVKDDVRIIAAAVGEKERGENVIREMDRQLKEVDDTLGARTDKKPVVYLVSQMTRYGGPGSMFHELLRGRVWRMRSRRQAVRMGRPFRPSSSSRRIRICSSSRPTAPRIRRGRENIGTIFWQIRRSLRCARLGTSLLSMTAIFTPPRRTVSTR